MAALRPEDCDLLLAVSINGGDLEGAVAFYEPDARFVAAPDNVVQGSDGIREVMRGMLKGNPRLTIEVPQVVQSGDLALLCSKWSSTSTAPDGSTTTESGNGREVVRRQPDGTWRFVIDFPNGGD
jgi:uncharacterized protein (TIGR02246 family)